MTRESLGVTMQMMTPVLSLCLMHLFSNWRREMWSTWFSARPTVFGMIPIIAPLLLDFYSLPCEIRCKTPTVNCIKFKHHTIKNKCAN